MQNYTLKKKDGTVLVSRPADSTLRSPAQARRRSGQVFNPPGGPFVQLTEAAAVSWERFEVFWRLTSPADATVLAAAAAGDYGDELKLGNPYEADILCAFMPGPEALEPRRFVGTPPNEWSAVVARFVRLA